MLQLLALEEGGLAQMKYGIGAVYELLCQGIG